MNPLTLEGMATPSQPQPDGGVSQSVGQTPINQPGAQSQLNASHVLWQPRLTTRGWEFQRPEGHSMQLEFQDTNLSPTLSLLPANSGGELNFTEYSLFQQTDSEFAPLRPYPDVSMASGRFHFPLHDQTTQTSEHKSLSQHPLAQATILSEERTSCFSVSQHSLSPGDEGRQEKIDNSHLIATGSKKKDSESPASLIRETDEDEVFFLNKDVPAKQLLDRLQKDVGMINSISAVSSDSETLVNIVCLVKEPESTELSKAGNDQSMVKREAPPGEAPIPQQQTQQPDRISNSDNSKTLSFEVCNITMGSRSTQPDHSTELLRRELLSEAERLSACEFKSKNQQQKILTPLGQSVTPNPTEMPESKSGVTKTNQGGMPWTGPFSVGVIQIHKEQALWSSGNQTGIDGSYLDVLPQSQSTPGVLKGPLNSSVKAKLGQFSVVESSKDNSYQSNTGISTQQAVSEANLLDTATQCQEEANTAKVQSLPSLNYIQKVDAWRANQSSSKTSLFDSLALQGFSGIPPKKKAYDAVSDTLNHILTQQVRNLQPPVSSAANQNAARSSSSTLSGSSSPTRGGAVGSAPNHKENTTSGVQPTSSTFGRSQSHSSLSTVVMLVQKDQHTETLAEEEKSDDNVQQLSATIQPSPLMTLSQFSDVSVDRDVALSSSQDSYNSGIKLGASIGTSSVISLEVDNYAPYWTSQLSTPPPLPRPQEINIEERIPLYLHNLGIDQSPSAILTPFVPRGPIRESEFSPTDLSTIKESIGTPSKSTQHSEGGSRHKGECSRSSILSVDSSISIPFSLDSLGPAVSLPEQIKGACSSDIEIQSQPRLASSPQLDEESPMPMQQQQDSSLTSSQNADRPGKRLDPDVLLDTNARFMERNVVSPMQTSCSMDQSARESCVSSKALWEIRKLLSQAENVVSAGSSTASTTSVMVPCLQSDSDICQSTHTLITEPAADKEPQECTAGSSVVLSKSVQRAEPEGCSAAPPDNNFPTQSPVIKLPISLSTQHMSMSSNAADVPEEEVKTILRGSAQSSPFSPIHSDTDQGVVSDASSESSLGVRVAKLLQSESPATMVSSTNSVTDQEESKARDLIRLKISGQQCESLELDKEDRERIEEIKRDLLLKQPIKSQGSTDAESSSASSVKVSLRQDQPKSAERFATLGNVNIQLPQGTDLICFNGQPQNPPRPDLEAQVREIAAREGVILPRINPRFFTSITIATQRHSTSPPSMSPAPPVNPPPETLCLTELSTGAVNQPENNGQLPPIQDKDKKTRVPALVVEPSQVLYTRNHNLNSHLMSGNHRQNIGGGQVEGCTSPLKDLDREGANVRESCIFDGHGTEQSTGATTSEFPARTSHISRVHLTPTPKASDHSLTVAVPSSDVVDVTGLQQNEFVPVRHSCDPSSPDEGVGLSTPPECFDFREPKSQGRLKRTSTSNLIETIVPQERIISMSTQSVIQQHKPEDSSRILTTISSAVPVLLPYKPHGSEELFYVPQTEADVSSVDSSDTTMESSHTGSDDAVPPCFSSEVLGHQDPGLDRGVNIRHTEGIYSKRLKTATFRMQQPKHTDKSSQMDVGRTSKMPSQASVHFARVSLSNKQEATKRDQGTSPVKSFSYDKPEPASRVFQTVHMEVDHNKMSHLNQNSAPEAGEEGDQHRRDSDVPQLTSQQRSNNLDQLWQRFCDCLSLEEEQPTTEREASLLERLERLSRLIHSTRAANVPGKEHEEYHSDSMNSKLENKGGNPTKMERNIRASRRAEDDHTRTRRLQVDETLDSQSSYAPSLSDSSFQSPHLFPAHKDESETLSTLSSSTSTIDTARLIQVFGAHRVQRLKTSSSLSKLYSTINKQKDGREQRRGRKRDCPHIVLSETTGTDNSVAADSATSTSSHTLPSPHGPSRSLAAKRSVRLVSKGIQAGNLEMDDNETRHHTRDVGTTFPSPCESRAPRTISSSSSSVERGRGGQKSPPKSQSLQQQRKSKRSPSNPYSKGVSWFIPADNPRADVKKENQPEKASAKRLSTTWFEPYSRRNPWREPLRQRQVHEHRIQESGFINDAEIDPAPRTKTVGLARVSLQEALEMHRPDFISRSRQRVRCLALQVKERKLQSVFLRGSDVYFNQPTGLTGLPKPAGTTFFRRAVPRKEMIQRSKQIYESLPEVQRRREEERRKAEYQSYRLNAQLYNKRVTNRVLGRSAWQ